MNFWIKFCTFVDEPQIALIFCNAYKEDHIFSDYVSGFSLWLSEMYWPLQRWLACQFRWIKQHLHIKKFYGTTENAVYLQLWIAVCDYLLLIIAKKHFNIPQTLHTISKSIGPLLFKQDDIRSIFKVTKELSINSPESQYIEGYLFWDFIRTLVKSYNLYFTYWISLV